MEVRTTGEIGTWTTWNNQPAWSPHVLDSIQSVSKIGYCAPKWESLTVTSAVQDAAKDRKDNITLGIKATDADERSANPNGWKRFENALKDNTPFFPKLWMKYNHPPFAPTEVSTDPPLPAPCFHCFGVSYVNNERITLKARIADPNGGQVRAV